MKKTIFELHPKFIYMDQLLNSTYSDLIQFLKKPSEKTDSDQSFTYKIKRLFSILILDIVISGFCILMLMGLKKAGLFSGDSLLFELIDSIPRFAFFLLAVVVLPFFEELVFRSYLRFNSSYLIQPFLLIFYIAGRENKMRIENFILRLWNKSYSYIFYFSALIFGFIHVWNYKTDLKIFLLFPLITSAQISAGIFAGYLRVRFNIFWGYFLHVLHNLVFLSPLLLMGNLDVNINNNNYLLKIEECRNNEVKSAMFFSKDSVNLKRTKLTDILSFTTNTERYNIVSDSMDKLNKEFNLIYKNKDTILIDKEMITNQLKNFIGFKLSYEIKPSSAWVITLEDSLLMKSHSNDSIKYTNIDLSKDTALIHVKTLYHVGYAIKLAQNKTVLTRGLFPGNYSLKLFVKDSTELKRQLHEQYGINLKDTLIDENFLKVDFVKK